MHDIYAEIKRGSYEFKEPWRATDRSLTIIVPIVRNDHGKRNYVVLEEVKDKVRITDTGGINVLRIEGKVNEATFIRGGTMLKGSTQERATQFGFITIPAKSENVPVHCIHASKGIRAGAELHVGESAPMQVYSYILREADQRETWAEVEKYRNEFLVKNSMQVSDFELSAPRDDLLQTVEAMKKFSKDLEEMLKRIPDCINQVGTVIIDPDGIVGLELYDHPDSWKAFSKTIVRSFGDSLTKEDQTGLFKPDVSRVKSVIQDFLDLVASFREETVYSAKNTETIVLRGNGYVGEYTLLDGKTIHLLVTRSPNARRDDKPRENLNIGNIANYFRTESERTPQESAVQRFFKWGKRKTSKGKEVMTVLDEEPKTWTDLENNLEMSKATLSSRLKELQERGVVEKSEGSNGSSRYGLTAMGQDLLHQNGELHSPGFAGKHTVPKEDGRTLQERLSGECPACHSTNSALSSFDKQGEHWQCRTCKHKWTKTKKE